MQIYGLLILANPPGAGAVPLTTAWELGSFSWLQRGTVQDMMGFMARTVSERTQPTQRQSVQENSYVAHVHSRPASDGISGVLITDTEYPVRVAFSLLNKSLDEFVIKVPKSQWETKVNAITTGSATAPPKGEPLLGVSAFPQSVDYVKRYQDPRQADTIMKVQQELDETKIVLHKTIDSVLQRGEDLDKLVEKSGTLSEQSKQFYKVAKKQNSCCVVM
ncbi:Synaptobrevin-like protein [Pseudozyma hubeiensis]|nr:Synaptobrevin-like protein [Pseudozyma hubeiensis]